MTLPGKVTICELEEDNPQRSYFRIKPLLTVEDGNLIDATETQAEYGDEGGIRIVPDKNDAMRFKSRMRTLGGYCLLDLTAHPNENEKIRPNKNYAPQKGENNRNIVYSDVILGCGELDVMQVFDSPENGKGKQALTPKVLLRDKNALRGPYLPSLTPDHAIYGFDADLSNETRTFEPSLVYRIKRNGEETELFISQALRERKAALPAPPTADETAEPADEKGEAPAVPPQKNPPDTLEEDKPLPPSSKAEALPPAPLVKREDIRRAPAKRDDAAQPARHESAREEPPRHSRREDAAPSPILDGDAACDRYSRRDPRDPFEGQTGLNPRRSKSLSEVVDYHWRQSRLEQLGAGVNGEAASSPIVSPMEKAGQILREAWNYPEGRSALIRELNKLENIEKLLSVGRDASKTAPQPDEEELNRLEAEKLELLRDIDKLKGDRIRQRSELMEETRTAHAKEIAELEKREQQLKDECASRERAAQNARQAQAEAEKLFTREAKLKLDSDFLKFAMFTKAAALIRNEESIDLDEYSGMPEVSEPTGAQMISDLRRAFEEGGRALSHDEALNYLACLAIGSVVIFSGPTGCGKSYTAHALASALGLRQKGAWRFARLGNDSEDVKKSNSFRELTRLGGCLTQRFMLLEDINMKRVADQSCGLLSFADEARAQGITLLMTCLDDQIGYPLQSRLLDRAFFIRMKLPESSLWQRTGPIPEADAAPSLECVRKVFLAPKEVPAELKSRMELLIKRLGEIGVRVTPRALGDMYQYCAAVCPLMTEDKINALDRAVAQRALPHILATAKPAALKRLPEILCDLPISLSLLNEPIALPPM